MNRDMITIREAKSTKTPHRRWQRAARKHWAIAAVKKRLTQTTILWPADLVSSGKISLGTNHPRGPQAQPYAATKRQIDITRSSAKLRGSSTPLPKLVASVLATIICTRFVQIDKKYFISELNSLKKKKG